MSKKLYVGNLPYDMVNEASLRQLFAEYGDIADIYVPEGDRKGFAFVTLSDDAKAEEAISALNGLSQGGRDLTVNEARPREDRPRFNSGDRPSFNRGGRDDYRRAA